MIRSISYALEEINNADGTHICCTAAFPEKPADFSSINGFIRFAWTAYCRRIQPLPDGPWKDTVWKTMGLLFLFENAEYLPENETFQEHALRISRIADRKLPLQERKKPIQIQAYRGAALYGLKNEIPLDTKWCFWYDSENRKMTDEAIDAEIMKELTGLKMEKFTDTYTRSLSQYSRMSNNGICCHEETITAVNMLVQLLVWCINSTSTRTKTDNDFDILEAEQQMENIRGIIRRTKNLY